MRQSAASKDVNAEAEESTLLETVTEQWIMINEEDSVCCSEKSSAWFSESAIFTCSYDL
jgi:hypothetical protein